MKKTYQLEIDYGKFLDKKGYFFSLFPLITIEKCKQTKITKRSLCIGWLFWFVSFDLIKDK